MVSFPYYSHTTPIRIPKDMGIEWETYHKGVPLLGVPENTLEFEVPEMFGEGTGFKMTTNISCQIFGKPGKHGKQKW